MTEDFSEVFARLGDQTRRAADGDFVSRTLPQTEVEGTSEGGEVRVRLASGKATGVDIDVRAMRLSNAELGDKVQEAINAAMQANAEAIVAAMQDHTTDFGALREKLADIGAEAQRAMDRYTAGMNESLARANAAATAAAGVRAQGDARE